MYGGIRRPSAENSQKIHFDKLKRSKTDPKYDTLYLHTEMNHNQGINENEFPKPIPCTARCHGHEQRAKQPRVTTEDRYVRRKR